MRLKLLLYSIHTFNTETVLNMADPIILVDIHKLLDEALEAYVSIARGHKVYGKLGYYLDPDSGWLCVNPKQAPEPHPEWNIFRYSEVRSCLCDVADADDEKVLDGHVACCFSAVPQYVSDPAHLVRLKTEFMVASYPDHSKNWWQSKIYGTYVSDPDLSRSVCLAIVAHRLGWKLPENPLDWSET